MWLLWGCTPCPGGHLPSGTACSPLRCSGSALCSCAALFPHFSPFCALAQPPLLKDSEPGEKMAGAGDERAWDLLACPGPLGVPVGV